VQEVPEFRELLSAEALCASDAKRVVRLSNHACLVSMHVYNTGHLSPRTCRAQSASQASTCTEVATDYAGNDYAEADYAEDYVK